MRRTASPTSGAHAPPRPLTPAISREIWAGLFGSYQRAAAQTLTARERELVLAGLESSGVAREEVTFVGSNVLVEDIVYGGEPSSYEEAKTWAKDPDWPVASPHSSYSYERQILTWQPEAVWYRSLTRAELDALR